MYPSHEVQHENYREWSEYLKRWDWQWMATLTFDKRFSKDARFFMGNLRPLKSEKITFFSGRKLFKRRRLDLIDKEKLQLGIYLLSSYKKDYLHFHALMLGRNSQGKTLLDCSQREWSQRWPYHAKIMEVSDPNWAADYVALHLLGFKSSHATIDSHGSSLLKQVLQPQRDGLDNYDGLLTN